MNYCDYLFGVDPNHLNQLALIDTETAKRYTYRELQDKVRRFAAFLKEQGFQPGDKIALHLYNGAEVIIAHHGIQYMGGVSCLLDPLITANGLGYYIQDTQCRCLCTHLNQNITATIQAHPMLIIQQSEMDGIIEKVNLPDLEQQRYDYGAEELSSIFYTSGTTNQPKGVMLCHKNYRSMLNIHYHFGFKYQPGDRLLCFVPLSHGFGLKSMLIPCMDGGATFITMRSFHPYKVTEMIEKEQITHLFGVPTHYQHLLRKEEFYPSLRKLKSAFVAAAVLKKDIADLWFEKTGLYLKEGFGLIETCTGTIYRISRLPLITGDVGTYAKQYAQVEIMDECGTILKKGERGEVVIRSDSVMLGYLNKPEETDRALNFGWFHTGDMGYKTEVDQIVLVGRIKDIINIAGIKVAPFEIENAINDFDGVAESAVVGVEDEVYGEVVKAFVKLKPEVKRDERAMIRFLQKKVLNFQAPKSITFVEEFPRNNMGKVDKKALIKSTMEPVSYDG